MQASALLILVYTKERITKKKKNYLSYSVLLKTKVHMLCIVDVHCTKVAHFSAFINKTEIKSALYTV